MRVRVTWWDILLGERRIGSKCAAARAIRRAIPSAETVSVSMGAVCVDSHYQAPSRTLQRFIYDFDACRSWWDRLKLRPFVFEIGS